MPAPALTRLPDGLRDAMLRWLPWDVDLPRGDFERRQRAMISIILAHVPILAVIGLSTNWTPLHAVLELSPVLLTALGASVRRLTRRSRMVLATTALVLCSSLLIHATGGVIESHFHLFAVVAVVTLYQAWAPFLVCLFWVTFHHAVVGVLAPETVYNHPEAIRRPVLWAIIHATYVLLASAAAIVAWKLTERASQRATRLLDATSDGVYGRTTDGTITFVNATAAAAVGRTRDELVGRNDHDVFGHETVGDACELCMRLTDGELAATGATVHLDTGRSFPMAISGRPMPGTADEVAVTFRDITQQREHDAELERLALEDPLTGLPNRTLLLDRLQRHMTALRRGAPPFAVLAIDLDRFKEVNDTLGHAAGDELLREASARLVEAVREVDTVARLGGDEFVVLLGEVTDLAHGAVIAERIRASLGRAFWVEDTEAFIGTSCGLRLVERGDEDPDLVLREADTALYASKRAGRGRVTPFDEALGEEIEARFHLTNELHAGLEQDQFVVHYQPMVDQATLQVAGFEALPRWQHPTRGLLRPEAFLAVAEDSHVIVSLGARIIERACAQLQAWHERAPHLALHVSVNVAQLQLRDTSLLDVLRGALATATFDPSQLWLEVDEATLLQENRLGSTVLDDLRRLGVALAIDDFGTGYASLAALRELPVDALKVAEDFVAGLVSDLARRELVGAVVGMAEALELRVVAQGVASADDLAAVRELLLHRVGDHLAQGRFVSSPMPPDEADWLVDEEARHARPAAAA